mgnify:CR=1 FL=1
MKNFVAKVKGVLGNYATNGIFHEEYGRFSSIESYERMLEQIVSKWALTPPSLALSTTYKHPIVAKILKLNYSQIVQSWQDAGIISNYISEKKVNREYLLIQRRYIDSKGGWNTIPSVIDFALLASEFMKNSQTTPKLAANQMYDVINKNIGSDGTVKYRDNLPQIRFVDSIGMICPFLFQYGRTFNHKDSIELAIKQIKKYIEMGMDSNNLPFHAYNVRTGDKLGIGAWCRGIGWFTLGLSAAIREHDTGEYDYFLKFALRLADKLREYQNEEGGFSWMVTAGGRSESSGTAMIGNFYLDLFTITSKTEYFLAGEKCLYALMKNTNSKGILDFSQGDSKGLGLYSSNFTYMPFAQGYTLKLARRIRKIREEKIDKEHTV